MALKILNVVEIVNIVNNNLVCLPNLKIILDIELFDPLRIQVVHDNFSKAHFEPLASLLFIKDGHAIRSGQSVHVWEILALKRESNSVCEADGPLLV